MPAEDLQYDALYQLKTHAEHLNALDTPDPHAAPYYEILSGALIWPDETNASTPLPVIWALRQLWNYRTRLMLDDTEPENAVWHQCVALFPKWVGFLPERRKPSPALLAEYRRGDVSLRWCLRNAVD